MLKSAIPEEVWAALHLPRRPSRARGRPRARPPWTGRSTRASTEWGVTVLQADAEMDAGDVWASVPVPASRRRPRASCTGARSPTPRSRPSCSRWSASPGALTCRASRTRTRAADARLRPRPYLDQSVRRIDWAEDSTRTVLRKLRAADSQPGVLDTLLGGEWYLHGGHPEERAARPTRRAAGHPGRGGLPGHPGRRGVDPRAAAPARARAAAPRSNCPPCGPWVTGCRRCPRRPRALLPGGAAPHLGGHPLPGGGERRASSRSPSPAAR